MLHATELSYNDIAPWRHEDIVTSLGGDPSLIRFFSIQKRMDLDELLLDEGFNTHKGFQFVELQMGKTDAPQVLKDVQKRISKA